MPVIQFINKNKHNQKLKIIMISQKWQQGFHKN